MANTIRAPASPPTMVHIPVGVPNTRREMPSWRDVTSSTAPVSEVRNMNSTSWLWAPAS